MQTRYNYGKPLIMKPFTRKALCVSPKIAMCWFLPLLQTNTRKAQFFVWMGERLDTRQNHHLQFFLVFDLSPCKCKNVNTRQIQGKNTEPVMRRVFSPYTCRVAIWYFVFLPFYAKKQERDKLLSCRFFVFCLEEIKTDGNNQLPYYLPLDFSRKLMKDLSMFLPSSI